MRHEMLVIQYKYRACSFLSGSALTKTLLEAERSHDSEQRQVAFITALLPKPSGI